MPTDRDALRASNGSIAPIEFVMYQADSLREWREFSKMLVTRAPEDERLIRSQGA